jgi:NADPH:quinone reductase-like Zn-dependent oxidoreductase
VLEKDLKESIPRIAPQGIDTWLELVGPEYNDQIAFRSMARHGTVVDVGMLTLNISMGVDFSPTTMGPTVKLAMYTTMPEDFDNQTAKFVQRVVKKVEKGEFKPEAFLDRVFPLEQIGAAHEWMEANKATGKVVITI